MKKYSIKVGMLVLGWILVALGIVGLFIPFLQGIIFLVLGALILSRHSLWFAKKLAFYKDRYPAFAKLMNKVETQLGAWTRSDAHTTLHNSDGPTVVLEEEKPTRAREDLPTIL